MGTMLTTGLQGFSTVAMGINAVSSAVKTLNDDTASFGTKLTSLAMAGTMGISALTTAFTGAKSVFSAFNVVLGLSNKVLVSNEAISSAAAATTTLQNLVTAKAITAETAEAAIKEL
jgi:hypothetical protein